jgi:DNA-binding transcriptional LysR family regulator
MLAVNLSGVDLNLLNVVAAVLEERSATRAARKLHVTQSAVSNALRRARELFGDPLVTREAYGFTPTPRGASLLPALRAWLEEARRLVANVPRFDPATSTRTFSIACTDAIAIVLLQPLLERLGQRAPHTSVRLLTLERMIAADALAQGEADVLVGMPPVLPAGHDAALVYRDPMSCIVRRDHPHVRSRITLARYASLPHVDLALFGAVDDTVDRALARQGRSRHIAVAVPHFSSVPLAVLETDCIATVSSRLARRFAQWLPLRILTPPVALEPLEIRQVWHRRSETDEGVMFLRRLIHDAATEPIT